MLITLIFALTLIGLGLLHGQELFGSKHPKLKEFIAKLPPFEVYLGLAGIGLGLFILLSSIAFFHGTGMVVGILSGIVGLSLGLVSGAQFLKDGVFPGNSAIKEKIDSAVSTISVHKPNLSIAAVVLGIISLVLTLFNV